MRTGAGMTTGHQPRSFGVEGNGGDRVGMARAVLGIDLDVAVRVPQSSPTIPASQQDTPAVPTEDGLVNGGIQGSKEWARVPQGGRVPEAGPFSARGPRSEAISNRGCRPGLRSRGVESGV